MEPFHVRVSLLPSHVIFTPSLPWFVLLCSHLPVCSKAFLYLRKSKPFSAGSLPACPQHLVRGMPELGTLGLLHGWPQPSYLSHQMWPCGICISRELESGAKPKHSDGGQRCFNCQPKYPPLLGISFKQENKPRKVERPKP